MLETISLLKIITTGLLLIHAFCFLIITSNAWEAMSSKEREVGIAAIIIELVLVGMIPAIFAVTPIVGE